MGNDEATNDELIPEDSMSDDETGSLVELVADSGTRSVESQLLDRDLAEKLLSRVGDDDRALLQMLYVEEMTVSEIAGLTGWSQSKVKIKAWRARNVLRKVLKKYL